MTLVLAGTAQRAVGTDIDRIALYLAERNARPKPVVPQTTICTADPGEVEDTPLTLCDVSTHIDAEKNSALKTAPAHYACGGRKLLTVVHAGLKALDRQQFASAGANMVAHHDNANVVLETD